MYIVDVLKMVLQRQIYTNNVDKPMFFGDKLREITLKYVIHEKYDS